jgi:hypothetical protein
MFVRMFRSATMLVVLVSGIALSKDLMAQDCHHYGPRPYPAAMPYGGGYGVGMNSGYGVYAPNPGYGGPMYSSGYAPNMNGGYYGQPAPYHPGPVYVPNQSIYVGSPYAPQGYRSGYSGNGGRYDAPHDHHHHDHDRSHHPWHLGHYLLGI